MAIAYAPVAIRRTPSPVGTNRTTTSARRPGGRAPSRAPGGSAISAPRLRLTSRGRRAVAVACAGAVLVALAVIPWRAVADQPAGTIPTGWATVTVDPGDTLWSLAQAADPGADPRPLIAEIRRVNGLGTSTLQPGQSLAVPAA